MRVRGAVLSPTGGRGAVVSAVIATAISALPVFLLGGLAVQIRAELQISVSELGILGMTYFATSAGCSLPIGRFVHAHGAYVATVSGVALATGSLLGIALLANSLSTLLFCLMLGGAANALAQIGCNHSLARAVSPGRQGLAFGVKQAAVPAATLLAGLAVPALGTTLGWRWAFGIMGGLSLLGLPFVQRDPPTSGEIPTRRREGDAATPALLVLGAAALLGSSAANSLGMFTVDSAVATGVRPSHAGLVLALGSAVGVVSRLTAGWLADRRTGGHLRAVAMMLGLGGLGLVLTATGTTEALLPGTVLAFGFGWSWPGLLIYAVVRLNPAAPAIAVSITQTGTFLGGAAGPLAFGWTADTYSYGVAWLMASSSMLLAACLLLVSRQILIRSADRAG
jgi:MFS family permease